MNGAQTNWGEKWPNPYIGPRPYTRDEGEKMGGREKEISHLLNLLIADRIILLHAPSGAGKTSLVQAGLIPRLEEEEDFWVSPPMRVHREPESGELLQKCNRYLLSLLLSLEEARPEGEQLSDEELAALDLASYLEKHLPEEAEERDQVFIFDQFEEILTVDPFDEAGKIEFFNQVGQTLRDRGRWALFIARDDYVARLEPYLLPIPSQLSNTFRLDLLRVPEALQAIRRPVAKARFAVDDGEEPLVIHFQEEATETLVDRLRQNTPYVEPVILQVVCLRLWEDLARDGRLDDGLIDLEDMEELVDVSHALSAYYSGSVARTAERTVASERQVRDWVEDKLINKQGVRTLVLLADEDQAIARELVDAHLVRVEERRGSAWAELAHDRLVDPVLQDNEAWRQENLSVMQLQAELWADRGMPDELLFTGQALKEAQTWVEGHEGELAENDRNFMDRSWAVQKRLDRERRRQRLFFGAIGIFGIIAIILAITTFILYRQSQKSLELAETNAGLAATSEAAAQDSLSLAEDNANLAATRESEAEANAYLAATSEAAAQNSLKLAEDNANLAATREAEALVLRDRANSRTLAIASQEASEKKDNSLSLLLAVGAGRTAETAAAHNSLRTAISRPGIERLALAHGIWVNQASWNRDESLILTASWDGRARVWDGVSGEEILALAHGNSVNQASWNGDESLILTSSSDGRARVWDAVSGEEILVLAHGSWVNQASWNGEESLILTASSDGTARVWDAVRGEEILTLVHEGRVSQASWNGEENLILTASDDNMARVWDAVSGEELFRLSGDGSAVLDAVWNSDESQIMIATEGGHVFRYFTEMKDLFDLACNRIGRNMSLAEWQTYYRSEPYACVCPNQPAHPTVLAAVDEGRITLAKDAQCAAD